MRNLIFKFFLWYSKKLGYEVSILKDKEGHYESYSNYVPVPEDPKKELEEMSDRIVVHTYVDPQLAKKGSEKRMANPVRQVNEKTLENSGGKGAAKLLTRKINEIVNVINIINRDRYYDE